MWAVRPVFARNPEFGCRDVDALGQFRQLRSSVNSDPEDAGSLRSRKESISSSPNFERAAVDPPQAPGDGFPSLRRLFSNKLQRNVQRLRPHPACFGRKSLDAFEETLDPFAHFRIETDADEYSHLLMPALYNSALRIISSACWAANWRMRLRSPGKFLSTTCVPSSPASAM